jgi:putative transposase
VTQGLVRYQQTGDFHFVTSSCYGRKQYLGSPEARDRFEVALEAVRCRYEFLVLGYVVMPEHVHLLVSEPKKATLATALQALKLSVMKKSKERPFWQARYYDFNVFTVKKQIEKLNYMHDNPVVRGLVGFSENWPWSSARHHLTGWCGVVEIESSWTIARRERARVGGMGGVPEASC